MINYKDTLTNIAKRDLSIDLLAKQWYDTKGKLEGFLLAGSRDTDRIKSLSNDLFNLPHADRKDFVILHFGPKYYERIEPLLHQLSTIEVEYHK
jgi:hypothetical protein